MRCSALQCVVVQGNSCVTGSLSAVAVSCSALQCDAVCCSVLWNIQGEYPVLTGTHSPRDPRPAAHPPLLLGRCMPSDESRGLVGASSL